jgi:predicted RNA-binding Zn-ribbon protein involved in translation (DUF1610 family)
MKMEPCPVCDEPIQYSKIGSRDAYSVKCPRCGNYKIVRTALANLKNTHLTARQKANISGWLLENQVFEITSKNLEMLLLLPAPNFQERSDKVLLAIEKGTEYAGQFLKRKKQWISWGWCINEDEIEEILQYLESISRVLKRATGDRAYKIIPAGWAHLEEIKKISSNSDQCFVAMWFDDRMQTIYDNAISAGILDAGYKPHRVDQREYNDKIDDEIIVQIKRSCFIVADFTGHRGGVYYEAGFAKGLGLEVIFTCRNDDMENLHFDIRQYNCIDWAEDKLTDFRKKLSNRIERSLGRGNYQQK